MLYNLFRFIVLLAIVVGGAWFVNDWSISNDATFNLVTSEREWAFSPLMVLFGVLGLMFIVILTTFLVNLLFGMFGSIIGLPTRYLNKRKAQKHDRGLDALERGLVQLFAGDPKRALSEVYRADKALENETMTRLIIAESAREAGKSKDQEAALKHLLEDKDTRSYAIRGLMHLRHDQGQYDTALALAEKVYEIEPKNDEVVKILFDLYLQNNDFTKARATLSPLARATNMSKDVLTRREGVLSLAEARSLDKEEEPQKYNDLLNHALRLSPGLVQAALDLAESYSETGNKAEAAKVLLKSWKVGPHPEIARAYIALEDDVTSEQGKKFVSQLIATNKKHPEVRMLEAELALKNEDAETARKALGDLKNLDGSAKSFALLAMAEDKLGADDKLVKAFMDRAETSGTGQWACNHCGKENKEWAARCAHCESFDTLDWKISNKPSSALSGVILDQISAGNIETPKNNLLGIFGKK